MQYEHTFNSFLEFLQIYSSEEKCLELLEQIRWNGKPVCVHCDSEKVYRLKGGKLFKCGQCRERFSARQGTIFEESKLPLSKWFYAIYVFINHKKGISSHQLGRDINVTQKTAWFLLGRIRYAISSKSFKKPLEGTVEADETYVGGKPRKGDDKEHKRGRGTKKTPVFGMVERGGDVVATPVEKVDRKTLQAEIKKNVVSGSTVLTDELKSYIGLSANYDHQTVSHGTGEFARNGVHVNTLEGFWSHLKRGIYGVYHHASKKHLHRYANEFAFRFNSRLSCDPDRFTFTLSQIHGRLTYENLIEE